MSMLTPFEMMNVIVEPWEKEVVLARQAKVGWKKGLLNKELIQMDNMGSRKALLSTTLKKVMGVVILSIQRRMDSLSHRQVQMLSLLYLIASQWRLLSGNPK